jgi:hypothetical protein
MHRLWPNDAIPGESAQLLPLPRHFAQLSELVTEDMISAPCGPSPEEHLRGAAAGAAGTTALNAATYLDMVVRGRGSSSAPADLAEAVAERADVEIPGEGDERDNRLAGLGPLSGTGVGVVVGAAAGLMLGALRKRGVTLPAPVPVVLIGATAMALSDVPLKLFGISDPGVIRSLAR